MRNTQLCTRAIVGYPLYREKKGLTFHRTKTGALVVHTAETKNFTKRVDIGRLVVGDEMKKKFLLQNSGAGPSCQLVKVSNFVPEFPRKLHVFLQAREQGGEASKKNGARERQVVFAVRHIAGRGKHSEFWDGTMMAS